MIYTVIGIVFFTVGFMAGLSMFLFEEEHVMKDFEEDLDEYLDEHEER